MKFKSSLSNLLKNKVVLNIVALIALLNVIGYIVMGSTDSLLLFIVVGVLTRYFSKNMIIVLGVPLILVNLFVANSNKWSLSMNYNREGLENNSNDKKKQEDKKEHKDKKKHEEKKITNSVNKNTSTTTSSSQGLPMTITPIQDNDNNTTFDNSMDNPTGESFEVGRSKKYSKGYNIDYASTVEDAYDELNKILGSDGIKRLTSDTQNLMKQQLQLAESMKSMQPMIASMAPLMQQAQGLLGSMGGDNGNLNNLANIAKQFSATLGNNNK